MAPAPDWPTGTFELSGAALHGHVTFAWEGGGRVLVQYAELVLGGRAVAGVGLTVFGADGAASTRFVAEDDAPVRWMWAYDGARLTVWLGRGAGGPVAVAQAERQVARPQTGQPDVRRLGGSGRALARAA
jgi:hypothetical protein